MKKVKMPLASRHKNASARGNVVAKIVIAAAEIKIARIIRQHIFSRYGHQSIYTEIYTKIVYNCISFSEWSRYVQM